MPTLLFVDACMRGPAVSRTHRLCRGFMEEYLLLHPLTDIQRVELPKMTLEPLNPESLEARERLIQDRRMNPGEFDLAWQFAAADVILVGAPYWDMSFPAMLKLYVEHVSVAGVTHRNSNGVWSMGLCKATNLVYISTAGGTVTGANTGFDYFRALCKKFGIPMCSEVRAENMDAAGTDKAIIMEGTLRQARDLARML